MILRQLIHPLSTPIKRVALMAVCLPLALGGCGADDDEPQAPPPPVIAIPDSFPELAFPDSNQPTEAKINLGRFLFYDTLLSGNQTYSCGTCHQQERAFTDGKPVAIGATNEAHSLGSMALANVGYAATLGWGNPALTSLEAQALIPMFGEEPVELGLSSLTEEELLDRLRGEDRYQMLFPEAFPVEDDPFTVANVAKAIATFERTLLSADSPYDRFQAGDSAALNEQEQRGMALFFSETLECFHCHGGFNFSDSITSPEFPFSEKPFHNNGMYNLDLQGAYPANQGVFELTGERDDRGRFKAPTLRNIAVTAPYLHDGSVATLSELLDLYAAGGRNIADGPNAGDGREHPNKSAFIAGFTITDQEKEDVLAFLRALTDQSFLENPKFSDPYLADD